MLSSSCTHRASCAAPSLHAAWLSGPLGGALSVAEGPAVYRPRHPERTTFYQVLDQHFDRYVSVYEERFESSCGPLRPVVQPTVCAFLDCGRLENGFARIRCASCKGEHLLSLACEAKCTSCVQGVRSLVAIDAFFSGSSYR